MAANRLEWYRELPYEKHLELRDDGDGLYYVYRLLEMPPVAGGGRDKGEALAELYSAFDDYVSWRLEDGLSIPLPSAKPLFLDATTETCSVTLHPRSPAQSRIEPTLESPRSATIAMPEPILEGKAELELCVA